MTEDDFERERAEAIRGEEERARRDALHDLESLGRREPKVHDHVTVVRVRQPGHDGADLYALARWSLAARLVRDAKDAGRRGEVADLGPRALDVCNSISVEDIAPGVIRHVGIARDGQWIKWFPPCPPEPVPGSPEQQGGRN
jgi:hypothetical protein